MKLSHMAGGILSIAGAALVVLSIINRDAGALWMPIMLFLGLLCVLGAIVFFTYDDAEAAEVRRRMDEGLD